MVNSTFPAWTEWLDSMSELGVPGHVLEELRKVYRYSILGNGGLFPSGALREDLDGFTVEWDDGDRLLWLLMNCDGGGEYEWFTKLRDAADIGGLCAIGGMDGSPRSHWKLAHRLWRMFR